MKRKVKLRTRRAAGKRPAKLPPPVRRVSNWPGVLAEFIEDKRAEPFDWVKNNCAFFASDWIARVTGGVDPARALRRRVTSALTAARVLRREGGLAAVVARACARLGCPEIAGGVAQRGDLALVAVDAAGVAGVAEEAALAVGVVLGRVIAFAGPGGLVFVPRALAKKAWRVG